MSAHFTHFDKDGRSHMVDVGNKAVTKRVAVAKGQILMAKATLEKIKAADFAKGDVLSVAELAGIMGAKQTASLIPLCHPIGLDKVSLVLSVNDEDCAIDISAECHVSGKTGVEMEALTAVSVSALTIYDMCKAVDKDMRITNIRLTHKSGGKSGTYEAS